MHKEFEVHKMNEVGLMRARAIGMVFDTLLTHLESMYAILDENVDPNDPKMKDVARLRALVRTKLEEAYFFAKKTVEILPGNSE